MAAVLGAAVAGSVVSGISSSMCGGNKPPEPNWTAYTDAVGTAISQASNTMGDVMQQKQLDLAAIADEYQFKTEGLQEDYSAGLEDLKDQSASMQAKTGFAYHGGLAKQFVDEKEAAISKMSRDYRAGAIGYEKEQLAIERQADKDMRMINRDIQKMLTEYARTTETTYNPYG